MEKPTTVAGPEFISEPVCREVRGMKFFQAESSVMPRKVIIFGDSRQKLRLAIVNNR